MIRKELLGGHLSTYQEKLAEPGVMDIINENQKKFEPYPALVELSIQNLLTTKMLMAKLKMMKQVSQYIVRIQGQLNRIP